MIIRTLIGVAVGAGLGALLGATRSCGDGGCQLTANPWRGAIWGAILGLTFTLALASDGSHT